MNSYWTITKETDGFFKDRGSKFHSFAIPVESAADVKIALEGLRKEFYDARHHCYAYAVGMEQQQTRANDDGEPGHSAGDPILGQIRSFGLTNVLVVVIRYFGGTKLGVGGLIHAYKTAAEDALKKVTKHEIYPVVRFELNYEYDQTTTAERILGLFELRIVERIYEASCRVVAEIRSEQFEQFMAANEPPNQLVIRKLE